MQFTSQAEPTVGPYTSPAAPNNSLLSEGTADARECALIAWASKLGLADGVSFLPDSLPPNHLPFNPKYRHHRYTHFLSTRATAVVTNACVDPAFAGENISDHVPTRFDVDITKPNTTNNTEHLPATPDPSTHPRLRHGNRRGLPKGWSIRSEAQAET